MLAGVAGVSLWSLDATDTADLLTRTLWNGLGRYPRLDVSV
jgi:hypothetical protein